MDKKINETKNIRQILWEGADVLRSKMDANDYKDYLLGIVFYKFLSEKLFQKAAENLSDGETVLQDPEEIQKAYAESYQDPEFRQSLTDELHFSLAPEHTYVSMVHDIANHCFQRDNLQAAFQEIQTSDDTYKDLFHDVDLHSNKLGTTDQEKSDTIAALVLKINEASLLDYAGDVLGDAYEYMIGQFASETGKKAGEFYTPKSVSQILTRIAIEGNEDKRHLLIYDPTMGSGSLLLQAKHFVKPDYANSIIYYGQELTASTYNLARMNMILHGVRPENQHLHNGNTLLKDWPEEEENLFDMVVMNPPYSQPWSAAPGYLQDPRFAEYGALPPKSKADYAFLLHGFYHLRETGTMAIVLPLGVLFRGSTEAKIREKLIRDGSIYAVIGLPEKLFYNTSIPTIVMVLKKKREPGDRSILFIDASKEFKKGKNQNAMDEENIERVLALYDGRKDVEKQAHLASFEEIERNEFKLNIPCYVDTFEKEPDVDLSALADEIVSNDAEIKRLTGEILKSLSELTSDDKESLESIQKLIDVFDKEGE